MIRSCLENAILKSPTSPFAKERVVLFSSFEVDLPIMSNFFKKIESG